MASVALEQAKILVLSSNEAKTASLVSLLDKHGQIRVVDSFQEAIEAIQSGHIDLVIGEAGDFLPDQCGQCARLVRNALVTSNEGVAAVDLFGRILWTNALVRQMSEAVLSAIVGTCLSVAGEWQRVGMQGVLGQRATQRLKVSGRENSEQEYEIAVSPVIDGQGRLTQMAVVVRDVTSTANFQRRLQSVEQAGQQLVRLDAEQLNRLDLRQRVEKIESQIASYAHGLTSFQRFSIRLLDRQDGTLNVAMAQGMPDEAMGRRMRAGAEGQGICGFVAATGRSYICPDTSADPRYLTGAKNSGSSLTVPLILHDEVVGVFNVESDQLGAFDDVDRQMLEAFGRYVAMALNILDLLVIEHYHTTGKLADDVNSEIAAPLNDILSDASALLNEYIGDETLRARLQAITENVNKIRESVKEVARPTNGIRGPLKGRKPADPLLTGKRLLVADDEDAIRETLDEVLRRQGCVVDTARDGAQAVNLIAQCRYDLVLSDIRMPHRNGYEVFAAAKERDPDCPVILITGFGYDPNHSIVRARQKGLSAVLFKPFKVDQLLQEVRQAIVPSPTC